LTKKKHSPYKQKSKINRSAKTADGNRNVTKTPRESAADVQNEGLPNNVRKSFTRAQFKAMQAGKKECIEFVFKT